MKKIISFSLYGNKPNFQVGAVVNVLEAKRLYPDWKCRFYTTDNDAICKQLEYLGAEIVRMDDHWMNQGYSYGSLWRFLAVDDADICIFRDADSVVNERELEAVNEWLATEKQWHIMHDHNNHKGSKIMAGMFGYRICEQDTHVNRHIFDFKNKDSMLELIKGWLDGSTNRSKSFDQRFLDSVIHPKTNGSVLSHGVYGQPFPEHAPCRYGNFVGDYSFWAGGWKEFVNGDKKSTSVPVTPPPEVKYDRVLDRVIVSCDSHPNYLDFWPLAVSAWKKIDVKATLVLIEKSDENIEVDETIGDVIRLKLEDDSVHTAFAAQAVRLLAPCLYPDENIIMADLDIIPLSKEYFFNNLRRGPEDSFIEYRRGCVGGDQVAMCWNVAKGSVWGDIFGVSATMENYKRVFVDRLKEWNPQNYKPISQGVSSEWFTDQRLLHKYLSEWGGQHVKLTDSDCGHRRLDHRMRHPPGMHDYYTDFCPRRPLKHNLAYKGRPDLNNSETIKHVFDWYKIPWIYNDIRIKESDTPLCSGTAGSDKTKINKKIYQTWKHRKLPSAAKEAANRVLSINPSFTHEVYDDSDIFYFIKENYDTDVLSAYESLNAGAAKADFWRYCVLYTNGGVYLDIDSEILSNLDELIRPEDKAIITRERNFGIFVQWCLMFEAGHPILAKAIDKCVYNIKNRTSDNIFYVTGPRVYSEAVKEVVDLEDAYKISDDLINDMQNVCRFYDTDYGKYAIYEYDTAAKHNDKDFYSESIQHWKSQHLFKPH